MSGAVAAWPGEHHRRPEMTGNPLVATKQDSTTWHTGLGVIDDAAGVYDAISSGSWVDAGLGLVGGALDLVDAVMNPVATLVQYGLSWLIEHVKPLHDALDKLAGDADQIAAYAQTWGNVSKAVGQVGQDLVSAVQSEAASWTGPAADAYRAHVGQTASGLGTMATCAGGISMGVELVGVLVGVVRGLVRDMVTYAIGEIIQDALEEVFSLGLATPVVVGQVISCVSKWTAKIGKTVKQLISSVEKLRPLMSKLDEIFSGLRRLFKGDHSAPRVDSPSAAPHAPHDPAGSPTAHDPGTAPAATGDTAPSSTASGTPDPPGGPGSDGAGTAPASTGPASTADPGAPAGPASTPDTPGGSHTGDPGGSPAGPASTPDGSAAPGGDHAPGGDGAPGDGSPGGPKGDDQPGVGAANHDPAANSRPNTDLPACGDPIDVSTGRMFLDQTDAEFGGTLPLLLTRSHRSDYRLGRCFGPTWASTLDQCVQADATGVHLAAADGMLLSYPHPAPGTAVLPVHGTPWPLTAGPAGYTVTDHRRGVAWHFPPGQGRRPLAAITDRNGNRIDIHRDHDGAPTEVRHSAGYRIAVDTDGGRVTALRLLTENDPVTENDPGGITLMRYRYDGDRLTEVLNSSGRALRFGYDGRGRVERWEDRNGQWYAYRYDEAGRCVHTTGTGGALDYHYAYDDATLTTRVTNSLGQVTTYQLNTERQVIRETDPLGNATSSTWDNKHQLLARTDPLGRTTTFGYDEHGNRVGVTRADGSTVGTVFDGHRRPLAVTDPTGAVWRHEYDERGNRTAAIDPLGATTRYRYDERGGLTGVTDPAGRATSIRTDARGLSAQVTDPTGRVTSYQRDAFGRITAIANPAGGVTRFGWTVEGSPLWRTLPDGATQRWTYDGEGNLVGETGPAGRTAATEVTYFDLVAAKVGADGSRVEFEYDTELRLVSVTNQLGRTWRYEYDPAGRLVTETDFDGRTVTYRYDAAGRLVERTDPGGRTARFDRDLVGNLVAHEYDEVRATFAFDRAGRMVRATNADADLVFERDAAGRVTAESSNGRTVTSAYDPLGRRLARQTPSGALSRWDFGPGERPTALYTAGHTVRFDHDPAGREITRVVDDQATLQQSWDDNDHLTAQSLRPAAPGAPGWQRRYAYHPDGRLASVADPVTGPRAFDLDPAGRVAAVTGAGWAERYAYDPAGNLTQAQTPAAGPEEPLAAAAGDRDYAGTMLRRAGRTWFDHDDRGRVVRRTHRTLSGTLHRWEYTWNGDDRLTGVTGPDGSRWRYRYDALGRRVAKERLDTDGTETLERIDFSWDTTFLVEQRHTGPGIRTSVTTWDWEPGTRRPVTQTERTQTERTPGEEPGQEWVDAQFYAIVSDLTGAPTELLHPDGRTAWQQRGSLWGGGVVRGSDGADTPLRFAGQYHDPETRLHYNYHRYYDPSTGRYLSADPLRLAAGPNPQAYVDDPTQQIDPLGLAPCYLTQTGPDTYTSPAGLEYGPDPSPHFPSRVDHVLNHANDIPGRPQHGVFGGTPNEVFQDVDDAYRQVQAGNSFDVAQGNRVVHYVNLNRDVGFVGGVPGQASGNPLVHYIALVTEGGNRVITAFPVSGIPSSVLGP